MRLLHNRHHRVVDDDASPLPEYLQHGGVVDAGAAYLVIPLGLLAMLPPSTQHQALDVARQVTQLQPGWSRTITYQVISWMKVGPQDLTQPQLAQRQITTSVDPATDAVLYLDRDDRPIPFDTALGYRPAIDPTPPITGAVPGARPPGLGEQHGAQPLASSYRWERARRLVEINHRKEQMILRSPAGHPAVAAALADSDELWGDGQQWQPLADRYTTAAPMRSVPVETPPPATSGADDAGHLHEDEQPDPEPDAPPFRPPTTSGLKSSG